VRLLAGIAAALALVTSAPSGSAHAVKAPHIDLAIAQNAAGAGSGAGCANARAVAFLNAAGNWGEGRQIAPGTVVTLCGTITSTIVVHGSGTPGKPVTIRFTRGAKLSQPACDPCLEASGRSWLVVDGGANGAIESTNNGTHLALHLPSTGIEAHPCSHCRFTNLIVRNIYVHDGSGDHTEVDQTQTRSIFASGSYLRIDHSVFHDAGWSVFVDMDNGNHDIHVDHNNIYNVDHGLITSSGTAGGSFGPIWFNNNHVHDFSNWDTDSNTFHHDGIHCYTVAGGQPMHISDFYIYDNRFDGSIGDNATSWIFMEDSSGNSATPCADSSSNIWLFNNVGFASRDLSNGVFAMFSGRTFAYQNTIVGNSSEPGSVGLQTGGSFVGPGALRNNVFSTVNQWLGADPETFPGREVDNNVYADGNPNGNGWYCNGFVGHITRWRSCIGGDAHSRVVRKAGLDAAGRPQPGSAVLGAGSVLHDLCTGNLAPLCLDIDGNLRPVRMAPDAGAFQRETALLGTRSLGKIRIGDPQAAVERFYGRRSPRATKAPLLGVFRISGATAVYRLHGGGVDVSYRSGKVVAVTTTSHYYSTVGGFGVGATADQSALLGAGWKPCGRAVAARHGGVVTAATVEGSTIRALTVARADALACAP
jgi:hypothetical protein